ncbi:MAG: heparinase II/III family protein [Niabella sp.]|nr:heparinase II/III family protein [Niabella sp.]
MKSIGFLLFLGLLLASGTGYGQAHLEQLAAKPHPRLLMVKGEEKQIENAIDKNAAFKKVNTLLLEECDKIIAAPALEHKKIGKRLLSVSREAIRRIFFLSYAYRMTHEKKYLDAATQQLLTISAFEDWNPSHYLDVAEMTMAAAIGYDWLYDELAPASREKIKTAILNFGIKTSFDAHFNNWLKIDNNWNQVCNTGITYGAIAIFESEPELCSQVIARAVESIKKPMKLYAPDGAYPEGYGYWSYGTTFNVFFINALEQLLGTDYGLSQLPGFLKTPGYMQQMIAPTGLPFNYSDAGTGAECNGAMFWFAKKLNDPSLIWNELQYLHNDKNKNALIHDRFLPTLLLWGKDLQLTNSSAPKKLFWEGGGPSPVAMMRTSWTDPNALFLGFKMGSPGNSHAHMDEGSFVFEAKGVRWAMDFGMQNYESLESKGLNIWDRSQQSERWKVFRYTNFAHNTLTFDDSLQRLEGRAVITKSSGAAGFSFAETDLTGVYKGQIKSAERGVALVNNGYGLIQDEITTTNQSVKMQWRMVTPATVTVKSATEIELTKNGKTLLLQIAAEQPVTIKTWSTAPTNSYDAPNPGTTIVGFETELPANSKKTFAVYLVPGDKNKVDKKITALKNWH